MSESTLALLASIANLLVGNPVIAVLMFALFVISVKDEVRDK